MPNEEIFLILQTLILARQEYSVQLFLLPNRYILHLVLHLQLQKNFLFKSCNYFLLFLLLFGQFNIKNEILVPH